METITRLILVRGGLPEPMVGYTVHDGAGDFVATPDLAYVVQKVAIEYQGAVHWSSPRIIREDIARREALERAGWQVILVVAEDLDVRSPLLVRRVRLALARG
jgi:very-short-patch-repair endonuclease